MTVPAKPTNSPAPTAEPGKRGRKPGQEIKKRPPLPDSVFSNIVEVAEENRVDYKRRREERSDQQKGIDKLIADMYQRWTAANRPTNWADMPVHRWTLPAALEDDALFLLRKGTQLHGRKLILGHREEFERDGKKHVVIPFAVIARPNRTRKTDSDE